MSGALGEARSGGADPFLPQLQLPLDAKGAEGPHDLVPMPRRLVANDRKAILLDVLRASDLATVIGGAVAAYASRYGTAEFSGECATFALLGALLLVNYMQMSRSYDFTTMRSIAGQTARISLAWSAACVTILAVSGLPMLHVVFPWSWFESWYCLTIVMLGATRLVSLRLIEGWRRNGQLSCRLAVVGHQAAVAEMAQRLGARDDVELVTTLALDHPRTRAPGPKKLGKLPKGLFEGAAPRRVPVACTSDELLALARSRQIDEIVIAPGTASSPAFRHLIRALRTLAIDVKLHAVGHEQSISPTRPGMQYGMPLHVIVKRPLSGWAWIGKRAEDIVISGIALLLLLPVLAIIALIIKLDSPGPVLFHQDRLGFNNDLIRIYKLRSMRHEPESETVVRQARRNDPRVTRIGRFLRRTSLDELPQLYNVLKGDMSLVGPRPHPVALNTQFAAIIDGYLARHRVKPGITGWAQIHGLRGETNTLEKMRRRVEHDLYYIDNWSLLLDLRILVSTIFVGFTHKNAY